MNKKSKDAIEYSIEIPKHDRYFFLIRKFLEDVLGSEKIPQKERDEIIVAVNEACDKLVRLGAPDEGEKEQKIEIRIKVNPKKITITMHYKGITAAPNYFKTFTEEQLILESVKDKIGEYLMEKSVDEVTYSSSLKKGHSMKITKMRAKQHG